MTGPRWILECIKTGRHWRYVSEGMARQAARHLGLKDYTIRPEANE